MTVSEINPPIFTEEESTVCQHFLNGINNLEFIISKEEPKNIQFCKQIPGSLIVVALHPFVTFCITRIFTVLFSACRMRKKVQKKKKKALLRIQQSEHTVGLNLFQRLIS